MRKLLAVLVLIAVAAAFAVSLFMIRQIIDYRSPWFGLMLMLDFLGLVAFGRPLFVLKMPGFLRSARPWETNGTVYRALRVPAFGMLLRRTPLRVLNPMVYLDRGPGDTAVVLAQLESAEAAHVYAAAILLPHMIYALARGWFGAVAWLVVVQIAFNLYPAMHLRWARIRVGRLDERTNHRKKDRHHEES